MNKIVLNCQIWLVIGVYVRVERLIVVCWVWFLCYINIGSDNGVVEEFNLLTKETKLIHKS